MIIAARRADCVLEEKNVADDMTLHYFLPLIAIKLFTMFIMIKNMPFLFQDIPHTIITTYQFNRRSSMTNTQIQRETKKTRILPRTLTYPCAHLDAENFAAFIERAHR